MLISVFNLKGGTGKTSISFSLAKDLDYYYITNDKINSIVPKIYNKSITKMNKEQVQEGVIFDCGGFFDKNIKNVLKHSKMILIPLENEVNNLNSLTNFLNELKEINTNIYIILNKVDNKKDLKESLNYLKTKLHFKDSHILQLPTSRALKNCLDNGEGVKEFITKNKQNQFFYRNFLPSYNKLLDLINNL